MTWFINFIVIFILIILFPFFYIRKKFKQEIHLLCSYPRQIQRIADISKIKLNIHFQNLFIISKYPFLLWFEKLLADLSQFTTTKRSKNSVNVLNVIYKYAPLGPIRQITGTILLYNDNIPSSFLIKLIAWIDQRYFFNASTLPF